MSNPWHINFCSGGIGSYICGKRIAANYGTKRLIHLFTDTKSEDPDLYRFLRESVAHTGGLLVEIADGRDLWQLFNDEKFIGNTRVDICSRVLKRDLARDWITRHFKPDQCVLYFGIDHSERERFYGNGKAKVGVQARWLPYRVEAPLCNPPYLAKCDMLKECERDGIDPCRMYDRSYNHANCSGFCVKGGHAHFLHLLKTDPEVFDYHAQKEQEFRERFQKDVAVMRDRRGGVSKPLPMVEFRRQVESGERAVDKTDWGKGCECFFNEETVPNGDELANAGAGRFA